MLARLRRFLSGARHWTEVERFDPAWRERIRLMASFLDTSDSVVVDLGCGPMWLRDFLPEGARYVGVDYAARGLGTLVCDFNSKQFPDIEQATFFVSGCLEYVEDPAWFAGMIAAHSSKCVLSYCTTEAFPDLAWRRQRGWVNDLDEAAVERLFARHGMRCVEKGMTASRNAVFVFRSDVVRRDTDV